MNASTTRRRKSRTVRASVGMSGLRKLEQPTVAGNPSVSESDSTCGWGRNSNAAYAPTRCRLHSTASKLCTGT